MTRKPRCIICLGPLPGKRYGWCAECLEVWERFKEGTLGKCHIRPRDPAELVRLSELAKLQKPLPKSPRPS